ncbi:hypothetical protein [Reyranella sp.]|uniref:hypothetical protein n=1 Tax=Reyranella sp. TaxID=1929291 RepID=UPI003D13C40D
MQCIALSLVLLVLAGSALAQTPPAGTDSTQPPSSYYPAPPPLQAPTVEKGAPVSNLSSPLAGGQTAPTRTAVDSEAEAQLFAYATKMVWGRYSKIKGAKPGVATVTKTGALWTIKGRLDSVAPGTEGDWVAIDGVVERIAANNVYIRGEVAFRVAKVQNGTACKVGGLLHFRRSGKSHVWRLAEGDNPCDGTREMFDLAYEKPAEKRPVPAQGKRT